VRFRSIHTAVAYFLAGLGMASLALGAILHPVVLAVATAATVASLFATDSLVMRRGYQIGWTVGLFVLFVVEVVRVATGGSLIECSVELAVALQVGRLWSRRGARQYQQIVVLALVHLIASSVLNQGISFGLLFVGFVVAMPWAMTLGHLRREIEGNYRREDAAAQRAHVDRILNSRRIIGPRFLGATALVSLPVFVMTGGTLFVLFPRIGVGFMGESSRGRVAVAGFSDELELGDVGVVRDDATVVMRVEVDPLPSPPPGRLEVHWRGAAFDSYDGRRWTRSKALDRRDEVVRQGDRYCLSPACGVRGGQRMLYSVYLEDLDPPILLIPPGTEAIVMDPLRRGGSLYHRLLWISPMEEVRREGIPTLVVHYDAEARPPRGVSSPRQETDLSPYLQLPTLSPRGAETARAVTAEAAPDPSGMAAAVARYLRSEFRYTLDLRGVSNEHPLEDFLFRRRAGHCEFFSTAMVVLLRSVGVPARNVTGFLGGRLNRFGADGSYYLVTRSDAHSWVEVYVDGVGWVTYDPTPPSAGGPAPRSLLQTLADLIDASRLAWDKNVVAYDLDAQMDLFASMWRPSEGFDFGSFSSRTARAARPKGSLRVPWVAASLALGLVVIVAVVLARRGRFSRDGARRARRAASREPATALLARLDRALARASAPRPRSRTPSEHMIRISLDGHPAADVARQVVARYNAVRFGGDRFDRGELVRLHELVRQIRPSAAQTGRSRAADPRPEAGQADPRPTM